MRIFIIHPSSMLTDHLPHGDGLLTHAFISELAKRGHELHVATENFDLKNDMGPSVYLHSLGTEQASSRIAYMLGVRRLFKRLNRRRAFDVAHQLNPVTTGLSLALAGLPIPIVLGPFVGRWPVGAKIRVGRVLSVPIAWLQQRLAAFLLLTTQAAKDQIAAGLEFKTLPLPYGIDIDEFPFAPPPTQGRSIVCVARISRRKGVFTLVDAFDRLAPRMPDAVLRIAGGRDEDDMEAYDAFLERIAVSPYAHRIEYLGAVKRDRVLALMRECRVVCTPSIGEPYGMSIVEAMSTGRPVVTSTTGGPYYLVDDEGGRRVAPDDPGALAAALMEILSDDALAATMGAHNRTVVEREYSWPTIITKLEAIYERVVAK